LLPALRQRTFGTCLPQQRVLSTGYNQERRNGRVVEGGGLESRSAFSGKCKKNKHNLLPAKHLQPFFISPDFTQSHPF
jgi:hypothetical protein